MIASLIGALWTGLLGLMLVVGLWRLGADLRRHDWISARRRVWNLFRVSLVFAGGVVLLATQGHGYRLAMTLVMVFCGVQAVKDLTPLKNYIDGTGEESGDKGV